jgi:ribosomal protein S18 acetylase RimI-like enzyme
LRLEKITRCNESHLSALGDLFACAFLNDPLYEYIFPEAATRETLAAWDLGKTVHYGIRFGEVYATSTLSGCAVWLPPGETDFTEERMAQIGMLDSARHIGADAEKRLMTFVAESEEFHKRVTPHPHWYLVLLGVDPPSQREGIGSTMLAPVFAKADAGGFPIYLETAKASNILFYQKHGFDVRAGAALSDGGAYLWYLVRNPKPYTFASVPSHSTARPAHPKVGTTDSLKPHGDVER